MSVRTEADAYLQSTREHLQDALHALTQITINHVEGWETFSDEYYADLIHCTSELMHIRDKICR